VRSSGPGEGAVCVSIHRPDSDAQSGEAPREGGGGCLRQVGATVPIVSNWSKALGRSARPEQTETPRSDDLQSARSSPRHPLETPRSEVGGEFRTPRASSSSAPASPRPAPRTDYQEISYEGMYLGTMKHGKGKLRMVAANYEGQFQDDMKHGQGTMSWDDGREYQGQFANDMFSGKATMTWPDGRMYVGLYESDQKHGEGTFAWLDGRRYQGQWMGGRRHGLGIYTNAKAATRRGIWANDRPVQWEAPPEQPGAGPYQSTSSPPTAPLAQQFPKDQFAVVAV